MHVVNVVNGPEAPDLSAFEELDSREIGRLLAKASMLRQEIEDLAEECLAFDESRRYETRSAPCGAHPLGEPTLDLCESAADLERRLAVLLAKNFGMVVTWPGASGWPYATPVQEEVGP